MKTVKTVINALNYIFNTLSPSSYSSNVWIATNDWFHLTSFEFSSYSLKPIWISRMIQIRLKNSCLFIPINVYDSPLQSTPLYAIPLPVSHPPPEEMLHFRIHAEKHCEAMGMLVWPRVPCLRPHCEKWHHLSLVYKFTYKHIRYTFIYLYVWEWTWLDVKHACA